MQDENTKNAERTGLESLDPRIQKAEYNYRNCKNIKLQAGIVS